MYKVSYEYTPEKEPIFKVFSGVFLFLLFKKLTDPIINSVEKGAVRKVKILPKRQIDKAAEFLCTIANVLSPIAYSNYIANKNNSGLTSPVSYTHLTLPTT